MTTPLRLTIEIPPLTWHKAASSASRPNLITTPHAFGDAAIWHRVLGGIAWELTDDRGPGAEYRGIATSVDEAKAACDMMHQQLMQEFLSPFIVSPATPTPTPPPPAPTA